MPYRKNIHYIKHQSADTVVILSGDQLYRINLQEFVEHQENNADITIAVKPVRREQAGEFGILQIDEQKRIIRFVEKPKNKPSWTSCSRPRYLDIKDKDLNYIASMGIYIFKKDVLIDLLEHNVKEDFGREVIPDRSPTTSVFAYVFTITGRTSGPSRRSSRPTSISPTPSRTSISTTRHTDLHPQALPARFQDRKLRRSLFADLRRLDHRGQQADQHRHRHALDHPRQHVPGAGGHDGGRLL